MAAGHLVAAAAGRRLLSIPTRWRHHIRAASNSAAGRSEERSVRVAHILLKSDDVDSASTIEQAIQGGADFAELARQYSKCPSASKGGELGWLTQGTYFPSFEDVAFSTSIGQVGKASTARGLHVIKVLEERSQALVQQMHVSELGEALANPIILEEEGVQLIDVREEEEYHTARLPGFKLLPLSQAGQWAATVDEMLNPERETIVLCHHGVRSMQVSQLLVSKGFKIVKNVQGGIHAYSQAVDPSVPMY